MQQAIVKRHAPLMQAPTHLSNAELEQTEHRRGPGSKQRKVLDPQPSFRNTNWLPLCSYFRRLVWWQDNSSLT
jgi:hypothetical protein